jgi:1-acyl-sn-glycerol-3-phosphate acyltransferase
MTPWLVRWTRPWIQRSLRRQQFDEVDVQGIEHVRGALVQGAGMLITPNHSFHYDSHVLIEASHRVPRPFHFMTAWQVFQMSTPFERWMLQRHGCFSVDRESSDTSALKRSIEILSNSHYPLVIFPEGDIYHHSDRVSPFRDGAAAIALSASKRADRKIVVVPCSLKCFYLTDPTSSLEQLLTRLETSLHWRPQSKRPLSDRVYRIAEGLLTLKEMEYMGGPQSGVVVRRVEALANHVLSSLEEKYGRSCETISIPERVRNARRAAIAQLEQPNLAEDTRHALMADMEDLFFVIQLYSYPGDYVSENPVIERVAETLDKFEEDVLKADYPGIRGRRRVIVRFGEPLEIPKERGSRGAIAEWTQIIESHVQAGLDVINGK